MSDEPTPAEYARYRRLVEALRCSDRLSNIQQVAVREVLIRLAWLEMQQVDKLQETQGLIIERLKKKLNFVCGVAAINIKKLGQADRTEAMVACRNWKGPCFCGVHVNETMKGES